MIAAARRWLSRSWPLVVVVVFALALLFVSRGPTEVEVLELPPVPSTTSTTVGPWCDPATGDRIVPGAGIQEGHPECPQPPLRHAPPGTKPNVGPTGEPSS